MEYTGFQMGEVIRMLRKAAGETQDALAQAVGVSVQAVSKWETGQSLPDVMLLPGLADYFQTTVDALFGRQSETSQATDVFPDDGKYRVVQYFGKRIMSAEECCEGRRIRLALDSLDSFDGQLQIEVKGSLAVDGDLCGGVTAGQDVNVSRSIMGGVTAGRDVNCEGGIQGNVTAVNSVTSRGASASATIDAAVNETVRSSVQDVLSNVSNILGSFGMRRGSRHMGARMTAFFRGELPDDDVLRVIQMKGRELVRAEECKGERVIRLAVDHLEGPLNVEVYGSAQIDGSVSGSVSAGDSLTCGCVGGNANAGDALTCGSVGGNANAGDGLTCGDVGGSATAGDSVRITGNVYGNVKAGDSVTCGDVGGDVRAESVKCSSRGRGRSEEREARRNGRQGGADWSSFEAQMGGQQSGVLYVVQSMDGRVLAADEVRGKQAIRLALEETSGISLNVQGDAMIDGSVEGDVQAEGSVTCGDVEGNVNCGGTVNCGGVEGDVSAGGNVNCGGIEGNVSAGGTVNCSGIEGGVSAGGDVNCAGVEGDINAQGSVTCGDVSGDVTAQDVRCGNVEGDVHAEGSFSCDGDIDGDVYRS